MGGCGPWWGGRWLVWGWVSLALLTLTLLLSWVVGASSEGLTSEPEAAHSCTCDLNMLVIFFFLSCFSRPKRCTPLPCCIPWHLASKAWLLASSSGNSAVAGMERLLADSGQTLLVVLLIAYNHSVFNMCSDMSAD